MNRKKSTSHGSYISSASVVATYLKRVEKAAGGKDCIYRGEPDMGAPLVNSAERRILLSMGQHRGMVHPRSLASYHDDLLLNARQRGFGSRLSDLELLTELQHFGAATCLLAFSRRALVALYFACSASEDKNSKLFIVSCGNIPRVPRESEQDIRRLLAEGDGPCLWQPSLRGAVERRTMAQDCVFLVNQGVEYDSITIKHKDRNRLLEELDSIYHVNADMLFVDIDGFSRNQSVTSDLKKHWVYFYRGNAKAWLKQYREVIKDYDHAIDIRPDFVEAFYNRGNARYNLGKYSEAAKDYDSAVRFKPNYAEALYNRGNAHYKLKKYSEAISDCDHTISIRPDFAEAFYVRGCAKDKLRQYAEAIRDYTEAIRLRPGFFDAFYNRGLTMAKLERYREAGEDFAEAIRIRPDSPGVFYSRGLAMAAQENYQEAEGDFAAAIGLKKDHAGAYYGRGCALFALSKKSKAIADCQRAMELAEQDSDKRLAGMAGEMIDKINSSGETTAG